MRKEVEKQTNYYQNTNPSKNFNSRLVSISAVDYNSVGIK